MRYLIRRNCEYSLEIEADSEDEAFAQAEKAKDSEWSEAWSGLEIEEE